MTNEIKIDKIIIRKLEEGIIENYFKGETCIEVEDFYSLREVNMRLSLNKPYTVLVEAEELTSFSKEARELIASKKFSGITVAKALMIKNLGQRIIGNFYLRVNKPHIKTKLFTDRIKAIEWLREQMKEKKFILKTRWNKD